MILVTLFCVVTDMLSLGSGSDSMLPAELGSDSRLKTIPSINEYFPQLKDDLTKVRWAHAVNSVSLLTKALEDDDVMMLEADIVLGRLIGQKEIIPIMAHPPLKTSDLSLEMFVKAVIKAQQNKRKGIKLDFKSTDSFQASWKVIDPITSEISFPVLLNADILPGPVNSLVKPVDPEVFLKLASTKFPSSTLSIGWTTKFAPGMDGTYTDDQLTAMRTAIEKFQVKQPVTLCVRAGIAAKSPAILNLVEEIDKFQKSNTTSVTVWMSTDSDPVDVPKLRNLILRLRKSRVFLDVPKFLEKELDLEGKEAKTPITAVQEALAALLTSISAIFSNLFLS